MVKKIIVFLIAIFIISSIRLAQAQEINGPLSVCAGSTSSFWFTGCENCIFSNWSIINGTGTISSPYLVSTTVNWQSAGILRAYYNSGGQLLFEDFPVQVQASPAIVSMGSQIPCSRIGQEFFVQGNEYDVYYQLQRNGINIETPRVGTGAGVPTNPWPTQTIAGTYRVVAYYLGCDPIRMSGTFTITSPGAPDPQEIISGGGDFCTGGSGKTISLSNPFSDCSYQLVRNGTPISGTIMPGNAGAITWPAQTLPGTYSANRIRSGCATVPAVSSTGLDQVQINVIASPQQFTLTGGGTYCSGDVNAIVTLSGSQPTVSYQLKRNTTSNEGAAKTQTGNAPITWNVASVGTYSYSVIATTATAGCQQTMTGTANITITPAPSSTISGQNFICTGGSTTLSGPVVGGYSYQWTKDGANLIGQTASTLNVTAVGNYGLKTTLGTCTSTSAAFAVSARPLPASIASVEGLKVSFVNDNAKYVVQGATDASSFVWTTVPGISPNDNMEGVLGRSMQLTYSSTFNNQTITVTPVKDGCNGLPFNFNVTVLSETDKNETFSSLNGQLSLNTTRYLYLKSRLTPGLCSRTFSPVDVRLLFGLGDVYNWGTTLFNKQVDLEVKAYYEYPGVEQTFTTSLKINQDSPEQLFSKIISETPHLLRFIGVKVTGYSGSASVNNVIQLKGSFIEDVKVNIANDFVTLLPTAGSAAEFDRTFSWTPSCSNVTSYQFQLMRTHANSAPTELDWSNATSLEVPSSTIRLAIVEGSANGDAVNPGLYYWRVRPLGNKEGGITNPENQANNWVQQSFSFTTPSLEESKNWIYSRTFTEGSKQSEKIAYANGLQQIAQQQTRLQSSNQVIASHTLQDFVGRNAVTSLPVPLLNKFSLGYQPALLQTIGGSQLITANEFDVDPRNSTPLVKDKDNYYGGVDIGTTIINGGVPNAEGFPYTRTVFTNDGSGRVREQSGVGLKNSISANGRKTVRTYYVAVSEAELVMVMGKEAPAAGNVQKIITMDGNDVASITYKNKDGKILATALTLNNTSSPLKALEPGPVVKTLSERVVGGTRVGPYQASVTKPLFFPQAPAPDVKINYSITPKEISEICTSICKACDYKIEFFLKKEGEPDYVHPALSALAPFIIPGGSCPQAPFVPAEIVLSSLEAGVLYTLEKRVTVYNTNVVTGKKFADENAEVVRASRKAAIDVVLQPIRTLLASNDIVGLNNYLISQGFVAENNQFYKVPVSTGPDCIEYINIPVVSPCVDEDPDTNCLLNGRNWEQYFQDKLGFNISGKIWFTNRYANDAPINFAVGQLNTMISNMLAENSGANGLLTCKDVWDAWKAEVQNYNSWANANPSAQGQTYTNDLLSNFLTNVNMKLDEKRPPIIEPYDDTDFCDPNGSTYYFIKKTQIYGKLGTVINPDVTAAYKLIYFDEDKNAGDLTRASMKDILSKVAGYENSIAVSLSTFTNLSICQKYKLYQLTQFTNFTKLSSEAIEDAKNSAKAACTNTCDSRRAEFIQAIIASIKTQNPSATIENYTAYFNTNFTPNRWVAVYDPSYMPNSATFKLCQINSMADALVMSCITNYCSLTNIYDTNGKLSGFGTPAEIEKLTKLFQNNIEVQVNLSGQTCQPGWDLVTPTSTSAPPALPDIDAGWNFGAAVGSPISASNYQYTVPNSFGVTNTSWNDNPGSLKWAINQVNALYNTPGTKNIYFNIPNSYAGQKHVITIPNPINDHVYIRGSVTIDGTSQPGFNVSNGPNIVLAASNGNGLSISFGRNDYNNVYSANSSFVRWIEFSGNLGITAVNSSDLTIKANKFNTGSLVGTYNGSNYLKVKGNWFIEGNLSFGDESAEIGGNTLSEGNLFDNSGLVIGGYRALVKNNISKNNKRLIAFEIFGPNHTVSQNNISTLPCDSNFDYCGATNRGFLVSKTPGHVKTSEPIISTFSYNLVSGTAPNSSTIEIFSLEQPSGPSYSSQPKISRYLATVKADGLGLWSYRGTLPNTYLAVTAKAPGLTTSGYVFTETAISAPLCQISTTLCFRFGTQKLQPVVVPDITKVIPFNPTYVPCAQTSSNTVLNSIEDQVNNILNNAANNFIDSYLTQCPDPSLINDNLTLTTQQGIHHFTLYYYDRSGNLIRTVPPKGVAELLDVSTVQKTNTARTQLPVQKLDTKYEYNTLGQLTKQTSPDGGTTQFWYNDIGQLRFSQNAQQAIENKYAYTKYDNLGRITEVGEANNFVLNTLVTNRNNLSYPTSGGQHVTTTYYSVPVPGSEFTLPDGLQQEYLRNRVSYTIIDTDGSAATINDRTQTVYSYDPHGNVKWLVHNIATLDRKIYVTYEYDLISGNVLRVNYNPTQPDRFFHKYEYDEDNRIKQVFTSSDGYIWDKDAKYEYYLHGPLKRTELGEDLVQGIDYTYTIQGWLKAVNHPLNNITTDPAKDGDTNKLTARDAFGMALAYFSGDYLRANSSLDASASSVIKPQDGVSGSIFENYQGLYNGNIAAQVSNTRVPVEALMENKNTPWGYRYQYDQLNRLVNSKHTLWNGSNYATAGPNFSEYTYDANGNIKTTKNRVDELTYAYLDENANNKLGYVTDAKAPTAFASDLETQAAGNYQYDAIGNIIEDKQQKVKIVWTPYGKVSTLIKVGADGVTPTGARTEFQYDASGNRVLKRRISATGLVQTSYYLRDAGGNVMAVYEKQQQGTNAAELALNERTLYGSDRLGLSVQQVNITSGQVPLESNEVRILTNTTKNTYESLSYLVESGVTLTLSPGFSFASTTSTDFEVRVGETTQTATPNIYTRRLGMKQYELKDHLGNVRNLISDIKLSTLVAGVPGAYEPQILAAYNYFPFGMETPGGTWNSSGKYRYGFNGKEKDDNGEWGQTNYDYGFRIYNPALGRFLSVDPLTKSYPMLTPYQFAESDPIRNIDIDGLEGGSSIEYVFSSVGRDLEYWWNSWSLPSFSPNSPAPPIKQDQEKPVIKKTNENQIEAQTQLGSISLVWGSKVTSTFRDKVANISKELDADPNHLMAIMAFESGLSPSIKNGAGSGATGLIQFMPSTAKGLGTTTDELADMSAEQQLDYVKKYFGGYKGKLKSVSDFYMAVLWPKGVGKANDYVLFDKEDDNTKKAYSQNSGLDSDENGQITKDEAAKKVQAKLEEGEKYKNTVEKIEIIK